MGFLTFWIYVPNNKNTVGINRDNVVPKGLQKMDFCLMTLKGMHYLQCQNSEEFHTIHSSCNIIYINNNNNKNPTQILKTDAHIKKCPTFDYPRLDQQTARNHTFSPAPLESPIRKHGLRTQKWDLWGSAFQPSLGRRHAKSWVP